MDKVRPEIKSIQNPARLTITLIAFQSQKAPKGNEQRRWLTKVSNGNDLQREVHMMLANTSFIILWSGLFFHLSAPSMPRCRQISCEQVSVSGYFNHHPEHWVQSQTIKLKVSLPLRTAPKPMWNLHAQPVLLPYYCNLSPFLPSYPCAICVIWGNP